MLYSAANIARYRPTLLGQYAPNEPFHRAGTAPGERTPPVLQKPLS